jgi:hypothetical protein
MANCVRNCKIKSLVKQDKEVRYNDRLTLPTAVDPGFDQNADLYYLMWITILQR